MPDSTDLAILKLLHQDAKMTIKELSQQLNLSQTPVYERIKKLESEGYVKSYTAVIDTKKLGYTLVAYCNISLITHQRALLEKFESDIQQIKEVLECYHIAGMYDYLLKVVVRDMDEYQLFLTRKLASLENIAKVQSSFVMTEVKADSSFF
jgi:Lrp/AsnC family transcriptional regulator, leucine-responsive regulatory protein